MLVITAPRCDVMSIYSIILNNEEESTYPTVLSARGFPKQSLTSSDSSDHACAQKSDLLMNC